MKFVVLLLCMAPQGQVKDLKVGAETRMDWRFGAQGFGASANKPLDGYDSTKQKYQLFVPAKPARACVVFISPGDGPTGLSSWQAVCQKEGAYFCSPYQAGNSVPAGQRTRVILDMLDDVRRKFDIDP